MFKSKHGLKNKKVLITCGPTWVALDAMRVISNQATGELGFILAKEFRKAGCKVTLLAGPTIQPRHLTSIEMKRFHFFHELDHLIKKELKSRFDIFVHCAAVSDYQLKSNFQNKISSGLKRLKLQLVPTAKIINKIKRLSPHTFLVGFKLESFLNKDNLRKKVAKLFINARCDLVVANVLKSHYTGFIFNKNLEVLAKANSRLELAKRLIHSLKNQL